MNDVFLMNGSSTCLSLTEACDYYLLLFSIFQTIMVSPIYSKYLYADDSKVKGVADINTSAVDLEKYPDVMKIKYWLGYAGEGDCIYIPQMWWHQVYSRFVFSHLTEC